MLRDIKRISGSGAFGASCLSGAAPARVVLAGAHSGVGKTTITMGILHVLAGKMKVRAFKVGPDYIDPAFHSSITGNPCRNLDNWILSEDTVRYLFIKNSAGGDISVIEGVMGLYDGAGGSAYTGSTAGVARILNAPVILVINGRGMAASAAAMVKGYRDYDENLDLKGVIINNISSRQHYLLLKDVIERDTEVKVVGYLPRDDGIVFSSRHLGLVPRGELGELQPVLSRLEQLINDCMDIPAIISIANEAGDMPLMEKDEPCRNGEDGHPGGPVQATGRNDDACHLKHRPIKSYNKFYNKFYNKSFNKSFNKTFNKAFNKTFNKIFNKTFNKTSVQKVCLGVALDRAFNFYYQDNLDLLEELGAELVFFSPLQDKELPPALDGIMLGGGFPEVFARELQDNLSLRREIKSLINAGMPVWGECGGLMYLSEGIVDMDGNAWEMVGAVKGITRMTGRLQRFGYVEIEWLEDNILAEKGRKVRGHEFHYSVLEDTEPAKAGSGEPINSNSNSNSSSNNSDNSGNSLTPQRGNNYSLRVSKNSKPAGNQTGPEKNKTGWVCGITKENMLAAYPHIHFYADLSLARNFLNNCRQYRNREKT